MDLRPPLKWAGGKRWQAPHLKATWESHNHRRLVEPFCGGLAISLALAPTRALLNDVNAHLIAFYGWIQQGLRIEIPMENDEVLFYRHRNRFNELLSAGQGSSREVAELFYYLNRTGFNGLCRFNRSGEFNVPFGRYERIRYTRDFLPYRERLAGWTFMAADFESLPLDPEDFVYADPPYDVEFTQYAKNKFTWADQERAAVWLAKHGGPVVLVNQATARVEHLYRRLGYELRFVDAPRMISCTGNRTRAREVIATRNL